MHIYSRDKSLSQTFYFIIGSPRTMLDGITRDPDKILFSRSLNGIGPMLTVIESMQPFAKSIWKKWIAICLVSAPQILPHGARGSMLSHPPMTFQTNQ